jgi:hypothetical protein
VASSLARTLVFFMATDPDGMPDRRLSVRTF